MQDKPTLEEQRRRFVSGLVITHLVITTLKKDVTRLNKDTLCYLLSGISLEYLIKRGMNRAAFWDIISKEFDESHLR